MFKFRPMASLSGSRTRRPLPELTKTTTPTPPPLRDGVGLDPGGRCHTSSSVPRTAVPPGPEKAALRKLKQKMTFSDHSVSMVGGSMCVCVCVWRKLMLLHHHLFSSRLPVLLYPHPLRKLVPSPAHLGGNGLLGVPPQQTPLSLATNPIVTLLTCQLPLSQPVVIWVASRGMREILVFCILTMLLKERYQAP